MENSTYSESESNETTFPNISVPENTEIFHNFSTIRPFINYTTVLYSPPTSVVVLLSILYGFICVTALIGNLLVLFVILTSRQMWTVTYILTGNLAIADIIMAIFVIPFHFQAALLQRWDLPELLCPICPFVQVLSVTLSVLTLSAIAVHRYHGIMNPLKVPISRGRAFCIILLMWGVSIIIALPTGIDYKIRYLWLSKKSVVVYCHNVWLKGWLRSFYNQGVVVIQYFLPLIIITWTYLQMGRQLWQMQTPGNVEPTRDELILRNKRKVTKMFSVVVIMFGICWLPFQTYNFLLTIFPGVNNFPYINMIWFGIHWLAMSNSCCNPFIYGVYSEKFRGEVRRKFCSAGSTSGQNFRQRSVGTTEAESIQLYG